MISELRATEEDALSALPPKLGLGRDKGLGLPLKMRLFFDFGGRNVILIFYKGMKTV